MLYSWILRRRSPSVGSVLIFSNRTGREQPDATATHPDHDVVFNIEAETTTPDRPAKVLQNLKRAHDADRVPLFVVRPGDPETEWATRLENILAAAARAGGRHRAVLQLR